MESQSIGAKLAGIEAQIRVLKASRIGRYRKRIPRGMRTLKGVLKPRLFRASCQAEA